MDKKRHQIDEREVADNFRFPRRCAPRNDDCVRVCVIARLGTSRGNLSQDEALYDVMLSEVEASPRWLHAMNIVSCRLRGDSSLHSE